jgi:hypothetical protein
VAQPPSFKRRFLVVVGYGAETKDAPFRRAPQRCHDEVHMRSVHVGLEASSRISLDQGRYGGKHQRDG